MEANISHFIALFLALGGKSLYFVPNVQNHFSLGLCDDLVPAVEVSCVCSGV